MLAAGEVVQVATSSAPDATVRDLSSQHEEPLPEEPGRGRRTTTLDVPKVLVEFAEGKAKATVTLYLDPLDPGRWLADTVVGGKRARTVVVHGAGDVDREASAARAAAGLPEPARPPQQSSVTFGGNP